jgi:hypothetical protein
MTFLLIGSYADAKAARAGNGVGGFSCVHP